MEVLPQIPFQLPVTPLHRYFAKDESKFVVLLYFGNFLKGFLSVGLSINMKIPVTAFDCAWLLFGLFFTRETNFKVTG